MYKLAVLTSHPIQYHVPVFKELSRNAGISLTVYYSTGLGTREDIFDKGFNRKIKWDIPLTEGYDYKVLKKTGFNSGIIRELKRNNYDGIIVFGYTSATNVLILLTKWIHRTPIIMKGEADLNRKAGAFKGIVKKLVLTLLFNVPDAFLYSYGLNREFFRHYGVDDKRLFFYPSAVDNEYFRNKAAESNPASIKKGLGMDQNDSVILFSGKLIERKRPFDLLKAFDMLANRDPEAMNGVHLVFVGDGILRPGLEDYVEKNGIGNVHFVGFKNQSEMPGFYSIADMFVLSSEFDPSPKSLNEAMNFSIPVIVTDKVGTSYELVKDAGAGFQYRVGDIEELTSLIGKLVSDEGLRIKMGKRGFDIIGKWSAEEDVRGVLSALNFVSGANK